MAGHMGSKIRKIQNLEIIKSDIENNLLFIKGSIPGSKNTEVLVKKAVKNIRKLTMSEKIAEIDYLENYIEDYNFSFNTSIVDSLDNFDSNLSTAAIPMKTILVTFLFISFSINKI